MEWHEELHRQLDEIMTRLDALMAAMRLGHEPNTAGVDGVVMLQVGTEV